MRPPATLSPESVIVALEAGKIDPFNIRLLNLTKDNKKVMLPITTADIYDGMTNNLADGGLFSTEIFGRTGDPVRDKRFSYIPLKTTIIHPAAFNILGRIRQLYIDIIYGRRFAVWDPVEKDFTPSNELDGNTGFAFFVKYFPEIVFKTSKSYTRNTRIEVLNRYRSECLLTDYLVMPAGLRDIEMTDDGRTRYDDINGLYLKLFRTATTIVGMGANNNDPLLNNPRCTMQQTANEIYDTIIGMLKGKKGFFQHKWGRRKVFNGTRNVITSMDTSAAIMGSLTAPRITQTQVGLFETAKGLLPIAIHCLKTGWVGKIFGGERDVMLTDPKTLKARYVSVTADTLDRWGTTQGLEKVINYFGNRFVRSKPVMIEGYYLGLIYKGKGFFKIFSDIDELPAGYDRKDVYPLTLVELLYLSGYREWNKYRAFITRYPVTGTGSIYPSEVYVKTTIKSEIRQELGDDWNPLGNDYLALEYPLTDADAPYLDTVVPSPAYLLGLGGDYDGDMVSMTFIYTLEAIQEVNNYLNTRNAYIGINGRLEVDPYIDTIELVIRNMTRAA